MLMVFRVLLVAMITGLVAPEAEAGPFRRRAQPVYQSQNYNQTRIMPSGGVYQTNYNSSSTPHSQSFNYNRSYTPAAAVGDGLDEVNAKRAARGLRPFIRDEGLFRGALACAQFRAQRGLFGHTSNDFAFGGGASATGCAAYPAHMGWLSCCTYDNYTHAGAAWVTGADGKRYMHLFVR